LARNSAPGLWEVGDASADDDVCEPEAQGERELQKGDKVNIIGGRDIGESGVVFWIGENKYGPGCAWVCAAMKTRTTSSGVTPTMSSSRLRTAA
jgi:hypothetical protein